MEQRRISSEALDLTVGACARSVRVCLSATKTQRLLFDDCYVYEAAVPRPEGTLVLRGLDDVTIRSTDEQIVIHGRMGGMCVDHVLELTHAGRLTERISLTNTTDIDITLDWLAMGAQCAIADDVGSVPSERLSERLMAIPFLHRATDAADWDNNLTLADLLRFSGGEQRANVQLGYGFVPSMQRASEAWAWVMADRTLLISKHNQRGMEFSAIGLVVRKEGVSLRFGGVATVSGDPEYLLQIAPGQTVESGVTTYELVEHGYERAPGEPDTAMRAYHQAALAYRRQLAESGCRFPAGFCPPVHWNELYDNPEWNIQTAGSPTSPRRHRRVSYTRDLLEAEAKKAVAYSADALYLDPGWDTEFASFHWGADWLGERREFVELMRSKYGLSVSLHCPLATWMSRDGRSVSTWPREALRMDADGEVVEGSVCLGSRQYLDAAAERLLSNCRDGVSYLMFDGNWWNGGCWNPDHGHPVPYTRESHCLANLSLAQRIHEQFPDVIIEMHDMMTGGTRQRYTPVYYKYGLPGSYDDNWGFELMWQPMEDILSGRARSLYYYNLACEVPLYLHIDLREDNAQCLCLWWYASTCRHLGIGGTHRDPLIAEAQRQQMGTYRRLKPFFTRGAFYGDDENPEAVHIHVLQEEQAAVVNLFNLSNQERVLEGSVALSDIGLDPDRWYITPGPALRLAGGRAHWRRRLASWGTDVLELWPVESLPDNTH